MPDLAAPALVLSLFPGIDLLGRGFEVEGFCIVRGPDVIFGGDIRRFRAPAGRFDGVIAGSPCPDFSRAPKRYRVAPSGYGVLMLCEFERVVVETRPAWWLLENVPSVPDVRVPGYSWLRLDLDPRDFGARQARLRHFQFGHVAGLVPVIRRLAARGNGSRCALATEPSRPGRRTWSDFCELQGLPRDFELREFTLSARYRAVGNGVHVGVARALAAAIRDARSPADVRLCACDCARPVEGHQVFATASCRKRAQRRRDAAAVTGPGPVTVDPSRAAATAGNVAARARPKADLSHLASGSRRPSGAGSPCVVTARRALAPRMTRLAAFRAKET